MKTLLQLRCFNVLLHLKYKVLLCETKIEFNNFAGGKIARFNKRNVSGRVTLLPQQKKEAFFFQEHS